MSYGTLVNSSGVIFALTEAFMSIGDVFLLFFTHKDFLPSPDRLPGTLFTPLHFLFAGFFLIFMLVYAFKLAKQDERTIRTVFTVLWITLTTLEIIKIVWETFAGETVQLDVAGNLPLYPCSIFMYAMPFAIFGKGKIRYAACGYVCTLGLLGGAINFIYPATILTNYSCLSFAGINTFLYHGALVFCTIVMLRSGYHSYMKAEKLTDLLLPAIPALCVSVVANIVNFSPINSDYMFFKLKSFFFAPIGEALPAPLCVAIVYVIYLLIHALPYLPGFIKNRKRIEAEKYS